MDKTLDEQYVWEHYKKVEEENFNLKRELAKLRKENKSLKHHNRIMVKELKTLRGVKKQSFTKKGGIRNYE